MSPRTDGRLAPAVLLQAAAELAREAGAVALRYYRSGLDVETKGDGSPVTLADRAAEQVAREWIHARFPADGVLGEEFGETAGASGRRWILDPIDGTKSFIRGVPLWGTLIAVVQGDEVLAGAAAFPAVDEVIAAAPGEGCWWNDARARVSTVSSLAEATVLVTDEHASLRARDRAGWDALAAQAPIVRTWGDAFGYLLVATGRAEVMVDPIINPWDGACFLPIIQEAGGVFTDWRGVASPFNGDAVATNAALSRSVRGLLQ